MSWLVSFFSGNRQNARRGQAMSSTHEAFSLPTSSPVYPTHSDAFNPETLQISDTETSRSYTYPPPSPLGSYGYGASPSGSRSQPGHLLPLHHSPGVSPLSASSPPYPPLTRTWNRIKDWLAREYPELGDTLNYGILPQDLAHIEMQFGIALPAAVRESYLVVDGQEAESAAGCSEGLFFGLTLLPLEDVLEEWRFWREVDDDPTTGANERLREGMRSIPDGWVRKAYSQRGWIPLISDKAGNYIGIDLNPGDSGSVGQVIVFGRDFDTKIVLWRGDGPAGWARWLASFIDELESGEGYELGGNDASEGSEDGLGYESYYYDGTGRGQGDGGGDTSSGGGLKLTGEYRGWNVLEAWADRSVRKWHEVGVIDDLSLLPQEEKGKAVHKPTLDILNLASNAEGSGAEVIMPVITDMDEDGSATALPSARNTPLPIINITKPPPPLPVDFPTSHDMSALPSPPDSGHSSLDLDAGDLESGHGLSSRQFSHHHVAMRAPTQSHPQLSINFEETDNSIAGVAALVPLPVSPASTVPDPIDQLPPHPISDMMDLLDDSVPKMDNIPIKPASPTPSKRSVTLEPAQTETAEALDAIVDNSNPSASADLDTTIRLVGGGGVVGTSEELPPNKGEVRVDPAEVTSIKSVTSSDSIALTQGGKHTKNKKSITSGLKRISQFGGGKRKKDSSGSVKDSV